MGRRWRGTRWGRRLDLTLAGFALATWLVANGWWLLPQNRSLAQSIPLHVTDILGLAVAGALTWEWRWARVIVYFWGLGLTTQAYVSPVLGDGPAEVPFWGFWWGHLVILLGAVYDVAIRGFLPTWGDYGRAMLGLACYAAVMIPVNLLVDANYGFVGTTTPEQATLLGCLGPWPLRLVPMAVLAAIALTLPMLPWSIARWIRSQRPRSSHAPGRAA